MTFSPRMTISPVSPAGSSRPAPSRMVSSIPAATRPEEPSLWTARELADMTGRRLGQPVALEHGDADGVEEPLELDVEQRASADEELEPAAEMRADLAEEEPVVEEDEGLLERPQPLAPVPAFAVVVVGQAQGLPEEGLDLRALLLDALLDVLAEALGQGRDAEQEMGPGLPDVDGNVLERLHRRLPQLDRGQRAPPFIMV